MGSAHWAVPDRQVLHGEITVDADREVPSATFGTSQPPRGLSGALRRAAYRRPDYESRRWALLILADRVDSAEDRARAIARVPSVLASFAAGVGLFVFARVVPQRSLAALERLHAGFT